MGVPKQLSHSPLADGLLFGEAPRFHNGLLYVSDMIGRAIYTIDEHGNKKVLREVENCPNGICFTSDGSLIYSSMFDAKLYRIDPAGDHSLYADLSQIMKGYGGDIVIDNAGRIYLDDSGARVLHGETPCPGRLLLIEKDGSARLVVEDLAFPNALLISNDGRTLFCAETLGEGLLQFDIEPNGALKNRRLFWSLSAASPDGVIDFEKNHAGIDGGFIDSEDGIWLSLLGLHKFVRIDKRGDITHEIHVDGDAIACALGDDEETLYLVTNYIPEDAESIFSAMLEKTTKSVITYAKLDTRKA